MAYQKGIEMKNSIIEATKRLILRNGYYNVGIKDIAKELEIPHSLIYYYYKNKDDIMHEIYTTLHDKVMELADRVVDKREKPLVNIYLKDILFFKYIVSNKVVQDFYFEGGVYAYDINAKVKYKKETCYSGIKDAFEYYNIHYNEIFLNSYVLISDAIIKALYQGFANGLLDITLEELVNYYAKHTICVYFKLSEVEFREILKEAFLLSNQIASELVNVELI